MAEKNCHSEVEQFYLIISCRDSPKIHLNCHKKLTQLLIPWFFGLYPHCLSEERKGGKSHCSSLLRSEHDWYSLGCTCVAADLMLGTLETLNITYDHQSRQRPKMTLLGSTRKFHRPSRVRSGTFLILHVIVHVGWFSHLSSLETEARPYAYGRTLIQGLVFISLQNDVIVIVSWNF